MKKHTLTVGIAAYNEEANIRKLLNSILIQEKNRFILKEIIISSDGSKDKTVEEARQIKDSRIKVLANKARTGKTNNLKRIFLKAKSDFLVLFDADIQLKDNLVIEKLLSSFEDDRVMLVGGNSRPFKPVSFFEKAVYSTFQVFEESRYALKGGNNIFGCTGSVLALKKRFYKKIDWKYVINDDDFLYFNCISNGYLFRHQKLAVVFYRLPTNLKDYLKQVFRSDPHAVIVNLKKEFGNLVKEEYHRPKVFMVRNVIKAFQKNPLGVIYISLVNMACLPFFSLISTRYKLSWFTADSTK